MRLKASQSVLALIFVLFCLFQCESAAGYKTEVEITPAPPEEETTKKSGFFSGIKSFFRSSPTTTTTALPPVLTQVTSVRTPVAAGGPPHPNPLAPQSSGAASTSGAHKPPPLAIPHAPLQPLGPRPDTPPSSPLAGSSQQPPHWPQPQVGQSQSPSTAGARPQFGLQQSNAQSPQMSAVANGGVATSTGGSNSGGFGAGGSNSGAGGSHFGAGGSHSGAGGSHFGVGGSNFGAGGSNSGVGGSHFGAGGSNFGAGSGGFGAAGRPGAAQPNMPSGFAPYHPPKAQLSGFDLSYGGGGAAGGHSSSGRPGFGLAPLTSTTTTTTTTPKSVQPPSPTNFDMRGTFGGPTIGSGSTTTTTTTHRPQTPKEEFPSLPAPRRPSIGVKEDFPPLPTPRSPSPTPASPLRPSSPGIAQPSSPFVWGSSTPATSTTSSTPALPSPGAAAGAGSPGVSFVPHSPSGQRTTTARPDVGGSSGNSVATDDEIRALTETLYSKEQSVLSMLTVNPQGKTRSIDSTDAAPQPLLEVDPKALEVPTVAKMRLLFNNYEDDTLTNEYVTPNERKEENDFVDAVMSTQVMRQAMLFLQNKGIVSPDPKTHRDLVKELWFTQYSRGSGKIGSSGFEHVFVHEVKNGTLIGLHNWVYWGDEEKAGNLDYKGYLNQLDIGNKAKVLKVRFTHRGVNKPVNGLFIGTTPELELALYTVCFQLRPDRSCHVSLGNSQFDIVTYTWRYRGKHLIGSAFPEI